MKYIGEREIMQLCAIRHAEAIVGQVPAMIADSFNQHTVKHCVTFIGERYSQVGAKELQQRKCAQ
jgi:hypothetical protein